MVAGNDALWLQKMPCPGLFDHLVDTVPVSDIGDDDRVGPTAGQVKIVTVVDQAAVNRAPESVPASASSGKIHI